jgi:hypothetical protein
MAVLDDWAMVIDRSWWFGLKIRVETDARDVVRWTRVGLEK